ncbi:MULTISPECIES: MFS transporter [Lysinibacillus]|uniref:MFS transporter n=1 Tax=Lysinibacillus TaxID=400634 RepID=UPI000B32E580|nr:MULTISPECIES: MFS transporter [Lysinibacillus]
MERSNTSKQKYIILGILFLAWIVNYLDKLSMNVAIIPIAEEFSLNETQAGLIISVFFMSYAVMQLVGGYLSDKYGARRMILISVLLWSIFTILTGFAWSFVSLIVIRLLFGIGEGSFPAASTLAIADNFPKSERGRAKSTLTAATTIGSMISTIVAAALIISIGWRNLFFIFGVLGFLLTIVLYFLLKPNTQYREEANSIKVKVPLKKLLKMPMLWQLMLMYFGVSIVNWGLTSWMPTFMVKEKNLDMVSMGALAIIPALAALIAVVLTGWLIDKFAVGKEKYLIMFGAFIAGISLFFMTNASSITMIVTFQALTLAGCLFATTTILTLPLKYFSHDVIGTATGFIYFGGQIAGAISPSIMGYIISLFNGSYSAAFLFLMVMVIIPILTATTLRTKTSITTNPTA